MIRVSRDFADAFGQSNLTRFLAYKACGRFLPLCDSIQSLAIARHSRSSRSRCAAATAAASTDPSVQEMAKLIVSAVVDDGGGEDVDDDDPRPVFRESMGLLSFMVGSF